MANIWQGIILGTAIAGTVYVVGQLIVFRQIEGMDYWEVRGYINGLVRGSGNYTTAVANMNYWRDWYSGRAWWGGLVEHFYNYGLQRADEMYG